MSVLSPAPRAGDAARASAPGADERRPGSAEHPPPIASCLYEGTIRHRRSDPRSEFRHPIALALIDLDELPGLLGGRLVRRAPGPLRFRRSDYLDGAQRGPSGEPPLAESVRDRVQALAGRRPDGPIRVLTQLRSFGVCFNPVSFYYCMREDGRSLDVVLAEVTNTPWGERHAYLLAEAGPDAPLAVGTVAKALHVSPLFGMDHVYHARASTPGETLSVHIENERAGAIVFDATLRLHRRPLTPRTAAGLAVRHPAQSARILALIYAHALALRLRGAAWHPHPDGADG